MTWAEMAQKRGVNRPPRICHVNPDRHRRNLPRLPEHKQQPWVATRNLIDAAGGRADIGLRKSDFARLMGGMVFEREVVKILQRYGILPENLRTAPVLQLVPKKVE